MKIDPNDSSEFFETIPEADHPAPSEEVGLMEEIYVSETGHTRLFKTTRYGKKLVLKTLKPELAQSAFYHKALQKEFSIGYSLSHPHICSTLEKEELPKLGMCIVQEYIDGVTLTQYMQQEKLTRCTARKIIVELCDALQYLHDKQIIHRDLKPDNILITYNGDNVKLIAMILHGLRFRQVRADILLPKPWKKDISLPGRPIFTRWESSLERWGIT